MYHGDGVTVGSRTFTKAEMLTQSVEHANAMLKARGKEPITRDQWAKSKKLYQQKVRDRQEPSDMEKRGRALKNYAQISADLKATESKLARARSSKSIDRLDTKRHKLASSRGPARDAAMHALLNNTEGWKAPAKTKAKAPAKTKAKAPAKTKAKATGQVVTVKKKSTGGRKKKATGQLSMNLG